MIDTIVIRVHSIHKQLDANGEAIGKYDHLHDHDILFNHLCNPDKGFARLRKQKQIHEYQKQDTGILQEYLQFFDTGKMIELQRSSHRFVASSHYNLNYFIDHNRNFIEFNFSFPKYFYGHNIAQFVKSCRHKDFDLNSFSSWKKNAKMTFPMMKKAIKLFFELEFPNIRICYRLVEVIRIDLCFNQIFQSKKQALDFLEQQRRIRKKYARSDGNYSNYGYKTALFYRTDQYSCKIYHKGSEYIKHDRKRHLQVNKDNPKNPPFKTNFLTNTANKILRYEISFHKSYINYLFNQHVLRQNCDKHRLLKKRYNEIRSLEEKGEFEKINRDDKKFFRLFSKKILHPTRSYFLALEKGEKKKQIKTPLSFDDVPTECYFSEKLMMRMVKCFHNFFSQYQVPENPVKEVVLQNLRKHNKEVDAIRNRKSGEISFSVLSPNSKKKKKIQENKIKKLLLILDTMTFDDLERNGIFDRMTIWRYKQDLQTLGYDPQGSAFISHIKKCDDFEAYHRLCQTEASRFFINNLDTRL